MTISKDNKINYLNIGLIIISMIAAFIMPFEVFLFSYAVLGPLHYLTEISWLHDRNYFTKGKYDFLILFGICFFMTLEYIVFRYKLFDADILESLSNLKLGDKLLFLAFFGAIIMAFVKNLYIKLFCIAFIFLIANGVFLPSDGVDEPSTLALMLTSFTPTLIHVYVFTGIFMLFGALKSRSKSGLLSIVFFILCPIILVTFYQNESFIHATDYGIKAFGDTKSRDGFFDLNQLILSHFFEPQQILGQMKNVDMATATDDTLWMKLVYESSTGILIMRFIAFAYTYHYLNWFSKTEIIRWHKVPKIRFFIVIALWITSLVIYALDYALGLQVLFFLSFSHVLLEFPLNFVSFIGIFKETGSIFSNGFAKKTS